MSTLDAPRHRSPGVSFADPSTFNNDPASHASQPPVLSWNPDGPAFSRFREGRMSRRRSLVRARIVATACALSVGGCTKPGPPPAEPAEVVCDVCGRVVARQGAKPHISLEGLDVYTCPRCVAKARQHRPPPHTPTRGPT